MIILWSWHDRNERNQSSQNRNASLSQSLLDSESDICAHYSEQSVIVTGMIHNSALTLPHLLSQLTELSCLFKHTFFLFFESNSDDNTTLILREWHDTIANATQNCNVSKHIIYGDGIVKKELNNAIKKRSNSTYRHRLTRVETFVPYRNMILSQLRNLTNTANEYGNIEWDYAFLIDMDVFEIDFYSFLSELRECPTQIMCIYGVDMYNDYRDSFATVEMSHNWVHRPFIFNKSESYYEKARNVLRKKMPRFGERFEEVRSCFNELAARLNWVGLAMAVHMTDSDCLATIMLLMKYIKYCKKWDVIVDIANIGKKWDVISII